MIYKVHLEFCGTKVYEIEANDEETAEEKASEQLSFDSTISLDIIDAVVVKSDNQYSAQQESEDDDRRHDNGTGGV